MWHRKKIFIISTLIFAIHWHGVGFAGPIQRLLQKKGIPSLEGRQFSFKTLPNNPLPPKPVSLSTKLIEEAKRLISADSKWKYELAYPLAVSVFGVGLAKTLFPMAKSAWPKIEMSPIRRMVTIGSAISLGLFSAAFGTWKLIGANRERTVATLAGLAGAAGTSAYLFGREDKICTAKNFCESLLVTATMEWITRSIVSKYLVPSSHPLGYEPNTSTMPSVIPCGKDNKATKPIVIAAHGFCPQITDMDWTPGKIFHEAIKDHAGVDRDRILSFDFCEATKFGLAKTDLGGDKERNALLWHIFEAYKHGHRNLVLVCHSRGCLAAANALLLLHYPDRYKTDTVVWKLLGLENKKTRDDMVTAVRNAITEVCWINPLIDRELIVLLGPIEKGLAPLVTNIQLNTTMGSIPEDLFKKYDPLHKGTPFDRLKKMLKDKETPFVPRLDIVLAKPDAVVGNLLDEPLKALAVEIEDESKQVFKKELENQFEANQNNDEFKKKVINFLLEQHVKKIESTLGNELSSAQKELKELEERMANELGKREEIKKKFDMLTLYLSIAKQYNKIKDLNEKIQSFKEKEATLRNNITEINRTIKSFEETNKNLAKDKKVVKLYESENTLNNNLLNNNQLAEKQKELKNAQEKLDDTTLSQKPKLTRINNKLTQAKIDLEELNCELQQKYNFRICGLNDAEIIFIENQFKKAEEELKLQSKMCDDLEQQKKIAQTNVNTLSENHNKLKNEIEKKNQGELKDLWIKKQLKMFTEKYRKQPRLTAKTLLFIFNNQNGHVLFYYGLAYVFKPIWEKLIQL